MKREKLTHRRSGTATTGPKVIELFSGAGFMGLSFEQAGCRLIRAYEFDKAAAETCARNVYSETVVADLAKTKPAGKCDILLAGPPCQGFSSLGPRVGADPRNALALVIPRWVKQTAPSVVVVENVPLFLQSEQWSHLVRSMERKGYETLVWILNARNFGVAQNRVRAFTIFSKRGNPHDPIVSKKAVTVRDAFRDLPKYPCERMQHYARPQSLLALRRIRLVPEAGDVRDIALADRSLVPKSWFKTGGKIVDIWGRLSWNKVSNTLRTGFLNPSRGRFLHPEEDRPISFREAARLQGLPDRFEFAGFPGEISRQIGNGVPIGLGKAVAKTVVELVA